MSSGVILCTASYDRTIKLWEATTGISYNSIQFPDSQLNCIKLTSNKRFLCGGGNKHIRIFKLKPERTSPLLTSFEGHKKNVLTLCISKEDSWMVSGSEDKTIKIWDFRVPNSMKDFKQSSSINSVEIHPNQGDFFSSNEGGELKLFDLKKGDCLQTLIPEKNQPIRSISFSTTCLKCACALNNGKLLLYDYDPDTGYLKKKPKIIQAHKKYILKCTFSPNGNSLVTTSADGTVNIYETKNWNLERKLEAHKGWVWDVGFSSCSGYIVTCSSDETAKLWDIKTGEAIKCYSGHQKAVVCVALNDKTR